MGTLENLTTKLLLYAMLERMLLYFYWTTTSLGQDIPSHRNTPNSCLKKDTRKPHILLRKLVADFSIRRRAYDYIPHPNRGGKVLDDILQIRMLSNTLFLSHHPFKPKALEQTIICVE